MFHKVLAVPETPIPGDTYYVQDDEGGEVYIIDENGESHFDGNYNPLPDDIGGEDCEWVETQW